MKRFFLWFSVLLAVGCLCAVFGFRIWFQSYLKSESCRQALGRAASRALAAEGEFTPLQPQSLDAVYTDGFVAHNGRTFRLLQADQLRAEVRFGFWARSCTVERLDITRVRVTLAPGENRAKLKALDAPESSRTVVPLAAQAEAAGTKAKMAFSLRRVSVANLEMGWNGGELKGVGVRAETANAAEWLFNGGGGTLQLPAGPQWRVDDFDARYRGGTLFLTKARLRTGEKGEALVEGEFAAGVPAQGKATFSGIPLSSLLPVDWRARLTGDLSGRLDLKATADAGALPAASGELSLSDGKLSALPFLDQVAEVTRAEGFRRIQIHKATAKVVRSGDDGALHVNDFVAESLGLLRVEGAFSVKSGRIEGTLQVGVTPASLQWIPGAKERVFTVSRDGYLWTPVRLSGLAAHPSEDLSARLAAAAVGESVETVKESVRANAQGVLDLVAPLVPVPLPDIPALPGF